MHNQPYELPTDKKRTRCVVGCVKDTSGYDEERTTRLADLVQDKRDLISTKTYNEKVASATQVRETLHQKTMKEIDDELSSEMKNSRGEWREGVPRLKRISSNIQGMTSSIFG